MAPFISYPKCECIKFNAQPLLGRTQAISAAHLRVSGYYISWFLHGNMHIEYIYIHIRLSALIWWWCGWIGDVSIDETVHGEYHHDRVEAYSRHYGGVCFGWRLSSSLTFKSQFPHFTELRRDTKEIT